MMQGFLRQQYKLAPLSVTTIEFNGVTPNYFRVNNGGNARIYAGLISMPTPRLYDFKIEAGQARMYCTDKGYSKLYLYNSSGSAADVTVSSFVEQFSPEVLAFCDFNVDDNDEKTVNVEIGGFTQSLPTGQNHIGKVTVTDIPQTEKDLLTAIKEACEGIGDISVGDVSIDMGTTNDKLDTINNNLLTNNTTADDTKTLLSECKALLETISSAQGSGGTSEPDTHLYVHEGDISYGEYWSRDLDIRELVYATNDGEEAINVCLFDNGDCITMTLKAGETLNNIKGKFTTIGVDTSIHSVTIPFRLAFRYV